MSKIIPTLAPEYAKRRVHRNCSKHQDIWNLLDKVYDPELPGLTIWDLGILQDVKLLDGIWHIDITLTYSGCPAVDMIKQDIITELTRSGYPAAKIRVNIVLSPAWTTEMMSPAGKNHLKSLRIAPPDEKDNVICPNCDSENTRLISQFGSTACKSLYQCIDCLEAFDYFKHF